MVDTPSLSNFEGELVATIKQTEARLREELPFRVLLMGDWSGRANRRMFSSTEELKTWRPLLVDRDNLDQLIARLGVRLNIPFTIDGSQSLSLTFRELDDFHPDRLFNRAEIFESLRQLRARLENPKTFAEAAAELREWQEATTRERAPTETLDDGPKQIHPGAHTGEENLLDQILASGAERVPSTKLSQPTEDISTEISRLAQAAAKPYLTPDIEADQEQLIAAVDARIAGNMNAILHNRDFQKIESAWRALHFLVSRIETGDKLRLYVLDISFDELRGDLTKNADIRATALYKLLVEDTLETPGGLPWSVIAGNYTFDFSAGDGELIEPLSEIAEAAGAPFIAEVTPHLLGCESVATTPDPDDWRNSPSSDVENLWERLTHLRSAEYVGLALPRFLLRLPYGRDTEPTEAFDFEEFPESSESNQHESYLWANASFAVIYLLAKGFTEAGWGFRPSDYIEIQDLPLHVYQRNGESQTKPCAEVLLTLRAAKKIIDRGLMPLLSMKDSDAFRLGMFQSIARTPLRGLWDN
jgi:type VI secretion system protein ImpC